MKTAIIYGGAFNPPTIAHQRILQACVDKAADIDAEVWVMPSGNRSDKTICTPTNKRLKMLEAFMESVVSKGCVMRVEGCELYSPRPTQTFQTYQYLLQQYPGYEQVWVFGADSIATMREWEDGDRLFTQLKMLITPRPGSVVTALPPLADTLKFEQVDVSSTMVRDRLARQLDIRGLVPDAVRDVLVI